MKPRKFIAFFFAMFFAVYAPRITLASPSIEFVQEGAYVATDADKLWQRLNDALGSQSKAGVSLPASRLGPVSLAALALEASEPPLDRVRYRLRYGVNWVAAPSSGASIPVSYVEVVRFNLGPTIHQTLTDELGRENVASAAYFGVGPHVGWRVVMQPVMGSRAMVMAAGRAQFSSDDIRDATCFGAPCLGIVSVVDNAVSWSELAPNKSSDQPTFLFGDNEVAGAFVSIDLLLGAVDSVEVDASMTNPTPPSWVIESVVEKNLGQDLGTDAAYRWGDLLDDSVSALWKRVVAFGTGKATQFYWAQAYECARGQKAVPNAKLCP